MRTKIDTPLQIHQGIHDPRVAPEQSRSAAEALKKRAVDVEYFEHEEGHGFVHPENERLSRERIIRFFSKLRKSYKAGP